MTGHSGQERGPVEERLVEEVGAVEVQEVEEPHAQAAAPIVAAAAVVASEAAHGVLENVGALAVAHAQHLAVEDHPLHR